MKVQKIETPETLLKRLRNKIQTLKDAENFIETEHKKFEAKVASSEHLIAEQQEDIKSIEKTKILISGETIAETIANEWGVEVDDLNIVVDFNDTMIPGILSKKKFLKYFNCYSSPECTVDLELIIRTMDNTKKLTLPRKIKLCDIQKNGLALKDFLDVKTYRDGLYFYSDFVCPDYRNLVFNYRLDMVVDETTFLPKNDVCDVIFKAWKRETKKLNLENAV